MPSYDDLLTWKKLGIKCIMNLIAEDYGKEILRKEKETGFDVYHLPIMDLSVPDTVEELNDALRWLKKQISEKKKTVVHCLGGIGRTSTVLIAFLIHQGSAAEEAFSKVWCMGISPQSHAQLFFLNRYSSYIASEKKLKT